jgi:HTH-type transcriptional regulator, glycine betaine synthesis regulator
MSAALPFPELEKFTTQLSELAHNWGFKRIHGKIWAQLFLSERPLDAADLIAQLDISKALVSISIRELLEVKAVEDVGRSLRGTHLYRANADLNEIALQVMRKRERALISSAQEALQALKQTGGETLRSFEVSETQISAIGEQLNQASNFVEAFIAAASPQAVAPQAQTQTYDSAADTDSGDTRSFTTLPNGSSSISAPGVSQPAYVARAHVG